MKIQDMGTNYNGYQSINENVVGNAKKDSGQNNASQGVVDASELNIGNTTNPIADLLKQKLQVQAQIDTMDKDQEFYDELEERKSKVETLGEEKCTYQKELKNIDQMNQELKEIYGVQDGSKEEEDLALMIRKQNGEKLTNAEKERLEGLEPTEYQKGVLDNEHIREGIKTLLEDVDDSLDKEKSKVKGMELSRIGVNPMLDTKNALKDVMKALDEQIKKTIVGELLTEEDLKGILLDEEI